MLIVIRKYGTSANVTIALYQPGTRDPAEGLSFAAGDITIIKDGGTETNITVLPAETPGASGIYTVPLTSDELTGQRIIVKLFDQTASETWDGITLVIETHTDLSSQHPDFPANMLQVNSTGRPIITQDALTVAEELWSYENRSLTAGVTRVVATRQVGFLDVVRGDSYLQSINTHKLITKQSGATWPADLTGYTITFTCTPTDNTLIDDPDAVGFTVAGAVVTATGESQAVRFDMTAAQTATLTVATEGKGKHAYKYDVQASSGATIRWTLETGLLSVVEDLTVG